MDVWGTAIVRDVLEPANCHDPVPHTMQRCARVGFGSPPFPGPGPAAH